MAPCTVPIAFARQIAGDASGPRLWIRRALRLPVARDQKRSGYPGRLLGIHCPSKPTNHVMLNAVTHLSALRSACSAAQCPWDPTRSGPAESVRIALRSFRQGRQDDLQARPTSCLASQCTNRHAAFLRRYAGWDPPALPITRFPAQRTATGTERPMVHRNAGASRRVFDG